MVVRTVQYYVHDAVSPSHAVGEKHLPRANPNVSPPDSLRCNRAIVGNQAGLTGRARVSEGVRASSPRPSAAASHRIAPHVHGPRECGRPLLRIVNSCIDQCVREPGFRLPGPLGDGGSLVEGWPFEMRM